MSLEVKILCLGTISETNWKAAPHTCRGYYGITLYNLEYVREYRTHTQTHTIPRTTHTHTTPFFPHVAYMNMTIRPCVAPWPISSRSFSYDYAVKLLKHGIYCLFRSTARTIMYFSIFETNDHYHERVCRESTVVACSKLLQVSYCLRLNDLLIALDLWLKMAGKVTLVEQ